MEGRFPPFSLLMQMLLLLVTVVEFSDSQTHTFPRVDPSRQQFFRLETITISCEGLHGLNGWRVMKKINGEIRTCISTWESSTGPCEITNAYPSSDSGEYWCEMGGLQRTNSVNITVTDGSVILESPVAPVKEGDNVIVYCRKKQTDSSFTAEFYKNGVSIGTSSAGTIITPSVSKSFEGLYKCSISEEEESPGSWLIVNAPEPQQSTHQLITFNVLRYIGFISLLMALLLTVGLVRCRKHKREQTSSEEARSSSPKVNESTIT